MPVALELITLFNALPTPHLLLSPELIIEAASDSYLHATLMSRERLVGQYMFDAFPDNPQTPEANGTHNVRASLLQVLATRQPHRIAQQHYDVPDPDHPGQFVERHWQALNAPMLDAQGHVTHIIHAAVDVTAEVQAQAQLLESQVSKQVALAEAGQQEALLYSTFEQAPGMICILQGPEHVFQFANPLYRALMGGRPLVGLPFAEAVPELAGQGIFEDLDQVYRSGEPCYASERPVWLDHTNIGPAGLELRYYNFVWQARRDLAGTIDGVVVFAYDVSSQVLARQQVEQFNQELETRVQQRTQQAMALQADLLAAAQRQAQARETFYQVFEQTPAAICIQRGPAHHYEYANQAYQDFFPGRLLIGQSVADALPETVDSGVVALLDHVYQTGETYSGDELPLLMAQPDGSQRQMYFNFTYQALRENGKVVGISTFAFNVAEQVLARRAREAQQGELQRIFEQAPVAIALFAGEELRITALNPPMANLFGYPAAQLLGRPLLEGLPELRGQGFDDLLRQVQATEVPFVGQEMPVTLTRHGQPQVSYYNLVYQPLYGADSQMVGVIEVATEVTEQVRARQQVHDLNEELAAINEELQASNQELNNTNRQLARTNVDLDTFVYTASHDLKAPITNIESIVLALRDTLPAAVQQEELVAHLLDLLNQTVARFQVTINQLTDISRLQLAHTGPAEPVGLAAVVEDVRLDLAPAIGAADTQLIVEVVPELLVSFSPSNLRSVVYNLLSNAIKYRAPDRPAQVRVRAEQTPQAVVLMVQDNGLGMSELQQRQLFGLFQRLHTHVEGTGVGLYISKRLIENAGGTIQVQSQPNVGTTFTVTFPA